MDGGNGTAAEHRRVRSAVHQSGEYVVLPRILARFS